MNDPDDLGIVDRSWLTDADWAVINRLRRIHETEGQKAVRKALRALEHFPLVMKRIRRCGSNWRILGV